MMGVFVGEARLGLYFALHYLSEPSQLLNFVVFYAYIILVSYINGEINLSDYPILSRKVFSKYVNVD